MNTTLAEDRPARFLERGWHVFDVRRNAWRLVGTADCVASDMAVIVTYADDVLHPVRYAAGRMLPTRTPAEHILAAA